MLSFVDRCVRRLDWTRRRWSTARDRAFHDSVFAGQTYDPFSASYPGYLTIRRFAALAEQHVRTGDEVLDLGCGPAEITCEMARHLPESQFVAVDHSAEALLRGRQLAAGLGLTNIRFELHDLEHYEPPRRVGLVTMFNAFHHVLDPARFVRRVGRSCDRFFLIEPAGGRLGQWQRTLDVDWLVEALLVIRDRLEYQLNLTPATRDGSVPAPPAGEPTEHRYSIDDFSRWFVGYGLDICGTVAGLERYGATPYANSPIRDDIGQSVYNLVVELEATLRRADLDLAAKHWAIYAERGRNFPTRQVPSLLQHNVQRPLVGPYDTEYDTFQGPAEARAGTLVDATVRIVNRSWRVLDSFAADGPIFLSYHWLDTNGAMVVEEGLRSPLRRPIAQGENSIAAFRIQCPDEPGRYTLAVELVHEHVTWFSRAGVPALKIPVRVV
jgi:SAM-dependent methyltransferase